MFALPLAFQASKQKKRQKRQKSTKRKKKKKKEKKKKKKEPGGATFFGFPLDLEASVLVLGVARLDEQLRLGPLVVVV